jgi:hypothetical protein
MAPTTKKQGCLMGNSLIEGKRIHDSKRKRTPSFSLWQFCPKQRKKRKVKHVTFVDFAPKWPPSQSELKSMNRLESVESVVYFGAAQIVLNLLTVQLGFYHSKHSSKHGKPEFCTDNDMENFDARFSDALNFDYYEWLSPGDKYSGILEHLVLPMASAFIHQSPLLYRIKKFKRIIGQWSSYIKMRFLENNFWGLVKSYVADEMENDWQLEEEWLSQLHAFEESRSTCNVAYLFLVVLESYTLRMLGLIDNLEFLFEKPPSSVMDEIERQVWEVLVIDWVKEESEEKYIRLYESEGALQFYLNWIIPERAQAEEAFMEALRLQSNLWLSDGSK